ncbi:tigger transposable element-derived protein 6-like [Episyrphus balteatus]|uniref:tigger transposable element-derived protein 6-like n=1 Tax=Episyrphus balteatus TaxID=286459 RepID=UPI0024856A2D|nr:tigger transposable element-derived protein 6-like [Episyrphus balteatus]
MSGKGRKLTSLTIKQKLQILRLVEAKLKSRKEIAEQFKCDVSTINRVARNKTKLEEAAQTNQNSKRKRLRMSSNEKVETTLTLWFNQMRSQNAIISGIQLMSKAKEFALKLNEDFEPTSGWLWRWKRRENIKYKKIQGELVDADTVGADLYQQEVLPNLISEYEPCNIFNADESGLCFRALPNGTLTKKGSTPTGGKIDKARLTLLFLCNADGTFKKVFAIGKPKNPRCFKGKTIPLPYYSQNKAWMTSSLWSKLIKEFDNEMIRQKRKVLLFVDNAACHKVDNLEIENVKIEFLPANTTSILQPLDQGIIHCFKAYYRQIIVRKQLLAIENGVTIKQFSKSITILRALMYIKRAWWLVKPDTISNCYQKAGFLPGENSEPEVEEIWDVPIEPTIFEEYVQYDNNVQCYGLLSEEEIIADINNENQEEEDDIDNYEEELEPPSFTEALKALTVIRKFIEHNNIDDGETERLEEKMFKYRFQNTTQTKITDYFLL